MEEGLFVSQKGAKSSIGGTRSRAAGVSARTTRTALPNKRVADNERATGSGGGDDDTVERILALCGPERDKLDTVAYNEAVYSHVGKGTVTNGNSRLSSSWRYLHQRVHRRSVPSSAASWPRKASQTGFLTLC